MRSYSYDDQERLTQFANAHPTAGNLATYGYGYDLNNGTGAYTMLGQRTSMTADVPGQSLCSALTKYYYDNLYQFTRADYPTAAPFSGEVHSWTYDAIGNRLTNTINGATGSYTYQKLGTNPNNWQRLNSDGINSYTYDPNGNTATRTGYTLGWDYENRMASITGGATATYTYDYSGRRSGKTISGATTTDLYDGLNLIAETTAGTTTYHLFGPGIDEPLASSSGSSLVYESVDGLGSAALGTDVSGALQNSYTYDAWGASRSSSESFAQPFRYTARERGDANNDLFYRARFYTPGIGRFLSEDPLLAILPRNDPDLNRMFKPYVYVNSNPVFFRDPLGWVDCGPYPQQTGRCGADAAARYMWGLCALQNNLSAASNVDTYLVSGALGFVLGLATTRSGPGAVAGAAAGVVVSVTWSWFRSTNQMAAAEAALLSEYRRALDQCKGLNACVFPRPPYRGSGPL